MSTGHLYGAGGYLDYGDAAPLLPVDELQANVYTHRDAECALKDASAESVLATRPTGLASSYALTQRPLTAIEVPTLDDAIRRRIDGAVDVDLAQFALLQVGRATMPAQDRSLAEF